MKVEMNLNETLSEPQQIQSAVTEQAPSCDVAIDIGQILAANQALLKNMARKMEAMETRMQSMEAAFHEQAGRMLADRNVMLLLSAPVRQVKPWEPPVLKSEEEQQKTVSLLDRIFRPWKLRRHN
jgi:hypothetical protein